MLSKTWQSAALYDRTLAHCTVPGSALEACCVSSQQRIDAPCAALFNLGDVELEEVV
jgi:hypothetical protein